MTAVWVLKWCCSPQHLLEMPLGNQHIGGCYGNPNSRVYTITVINVIQTLLIFQHHSYSRKEQKPWLSTEFSTAQSSAASLLVLFFKWILFSWLCHSKISYCFYSCTHSFWLFFFDRTWSRTRKVGLQLRHRTPAKGGRIYILNVETLRKILEHFVHRL